MNTVNKVVIGFALGLAFLLVFGIPAVPQVGPAERIADAKPNDVRILATAAIRVPLDAVRAEAAKAIGRPLVIEYGSARGNLKDMIMAGAGFEVAMLLPDVDEELLKARKIASQGVVIGKTDVAIGVRGDGTPDLGTPDKIKSAMLKARSLRWSDTGAALFTVNKILDTLKIRDAVKPRHNLSARARTARARRIRNQYLSAQRDPVEPKSQKHGSRHTGAASAGRRHRHDLHKYAECGSRHGAGHVPPRARDRARAEGERIQSAMKQPQETAVSKGAVT